MTQHYLNPMKQFQQKIGTFPDGGFGPDTFKKGAAFLKLTDRRAVHFFAQCAHESVHFKVFEENLNYSAAGLRKVFRKYFPTAALAKQYERKPRNIASRVYANRMGNGDEVSGDGWKYRGRGAIQLTGKNNYTAFAQWVGDARIIDNPDLVEDHYAFESAVWFFERNNLWVICDEGYSNGTIEKLTRRINGGTNGLADRIRLTKQYQKYAAF